MKKWVVFLLMLPLVAVGCAGIDFYYKDSANNFFGSGRTISIINNSPATTEIFINGKKFEGRQVNDNQAPQLEKEYQVKPGEQLTFGPRTDITVITARAMTVAGPRFSKEIIVNNYNDYYNRKYNTPVYLDEKVFDYALIADYPSP